MLVLTRKVGETIVIDDDIEITVVQVKGKQVRVGIKAPKDVKVHRLEIYKSIQAKEGDTPQEDDDDLKTGTED